VAELTGGSINAVRTSLRELHLDGDIESAGKPRGQMQMWFPAAEATREAIRQHRQAEALQTSVATPFRPQIAGTWSGVTWGNEVARPGGEDHKDFGSLQADGTIKPYHAPRFGCVGNLKDTSGSGR
jgi:hypothetical protein